MKLQLYYHSISPSARAVYILLKTNSIPFEKIVVDVINGEQYLPEFKKINPINQLPVLHHNKFILRESAAIMNYICDTFNLPEHWYPKPLKSRARIDEFMHWHHMMGKANVKLLYDQEYMYARWRDEQAKPESEYHDNLLREYLDLIDKVWLRDKLFVTGHQISIADLIAAAYADHYDYLGYKSRENRQRMSEWMDRVSQETQPHYQEAHALIHKFKYLLTKKFRPTSDYLEKGSKNLITQQLKKS